MKPEELQEAIDKHARVAALDIFLRDLLGEQPWKGGFELKVGGYECAFGARHGPALKELLQQERAELVDWLKSRGVEV